MNRRELRIINGFNPHGNIRQLLRTIRRSVRDMSDGTMHGLPGYGRNLVARHLAEVAKLRRDGLYGDARIWLARARKIRMTGYTTAGIYVGHSILP